MKFNNKFLLVIYILTHIPECQAPIAFNEIRFEKNTSKNREIFLILNNNNKEFLEISSNTGIILHILKFYSQPPDPQAQDAKNKSYLKNLDNTKFISEMNEIKAIPESLHKQSELYIVKHETIQRVFKRKLMSFVMPQLNEYEEDSGETYDQLKDEYKKKSAKEGITDNTALSEFEISFNNIKNVEYFTDKGTINTTINNKKLIFNDKGGFINERIKILGIQVFFVSFKSPIILINRLIKKEDIILFYQYIELNMINAYPFEKMFIVDCEFKGRLLSKGLAENLKADSATKTGLEVILDTFEENDGYYIDNSFYIIKLAVLKQNYVNANKFLNYEEPRYFKAKLIKGYDNYSCKHDEEFCHESLVESSTEDDLGEIKKVPDTIEKSTSSISLRNVMKLLKDSNPPYKSLHDSSQRAKKLKTSRKGARKRSKATTGSDCSGNPKRGKHSRNPISSTSTTV
jgi:hypothetical protein